MKTSMESVEAIKELARVVTTTIEGIDPSFFDRNQYGDAATFRQTVVLCLMDANDVVPVDFDRLLESGDANIMHDVMGIMNNWNIYKKEMENCFHPRCAVTQ